MPGGAVIRLRHAARDLPRPYKTWGYPVTPIVFILFALWLVFNTAREQPVDAAMSAVLILAGLPLYWWWKAGWGGRHRYSLSAPGFPAPAPPFPRPPPLPPTCAVPP